MFKFWNHINSSKSPIVLEALKVSELLASKKKQSWCYDLKRVLSHVNICETPSTGSQLPIKFLDRRINDIYDCSWNEERTELSKGKLSLYTKLKQSQSFEQYLNLSNLT